MSHRCPCRLDGSVVMREQMEGRDWLMSAPESRASAGGCGVGSGALAAWLNQFFPREGATREVVYPFRIVFGVALVLTIVTGFRAARRRDFARHRTWMIRSYAIALVAGTQVFTLGFGNTILGTGDLPTALLMISAWVINLAVAEWAIRKRPRRRTPVTQVQMATP